jgi:hypothetical protein
MFASHRKPYLLHALTVLLALLGTFLIAGAQPGGLKDARLRVYFYSAGLPYTQPTTLNITCSGIDTFSADNPLLNPGRIYHPQQVFSYSLECPIFGCQASMAYYMEGKLVDSCSFSGISQGVRFLAGQSQGFPFDACQQGCDLILVIPPEAGLGGTLAPYSLSSFFQSYDGRFLSALALTIALQTPLLLALARSICKVPGVCTSRLVAAGTLVTLVTVPLLWYAAPEMSTARYSVAYGALLIFMVGSLLFLLFLRARPRQAFVMSLGASIAALSVLFFLLP